MRVNLPFLNSRSNFCLSTLQPEEKKRRRKRCEFIREKERRERIQRRREWNLPSRLSEWNYVQLKESWVISLSQKQPNLALFLSLRQIRSATVAVTVADLQCQSHMKLQKGQYSPSLFLFLFLCISPSFPLVTRTKKNHPHWPIVSLSSIHLHFAIHPSIHPGSKGFCIVSERKRKRTNERVREHPLHDIGSECQESQVNART